MDRREKPVYFDCDDTLVMWKGLGHWDNEEPGVVPVKCVFDNSEIYLKPHTKMIEKLKTLHARGMYIVIWSAGGYEWAKAVMEALQLQKYTHLVIGKPIMMFDDLPTEEALGKTKYIPYDKEY